MPLLDLTTPLLDTLRQIDSLARSQQNAPPRSVSKLAFELLQSPREEQELTPVLYHSMVQSASRINRVRLAVTGLAWLGSGVQSVQQEMTSIIRSARSELALCSYSITSGAGLLIDEIADVARQGVLVTLIINNLRDQPADVRSKIRNWDEATRAHLRLFDFNTGDRQAQLHAKVIVADRTTALVGSANLSFHGMVSNHELAVILKGPVAEEIAGRLDTLRSASTEVDIRTVMANGI